MTWTDGQWVGGPAGSEHGIRAADRVLGDESPAIWLSNIENGFDHEKRRSLGQELAHIGHRKARFREWCGCGDRESRVVGVHAFTPAFRGSDACAEHRTDPYGLGTTEWAAVSP